MSVRRYSFRPPRGKIPVDGIIVEGYTTVDESMVTGESLPVEKTAGDEIIRATINKTVPSYLRPQK